MPYGRPQPFNSRMSYFRDASVLRSLQNALKGLTTVEQIENSNQNKFINCTRIKVLMVQSEWKGNIGNFQIKNINGNINTVQQHQQQQNLFKISAA